MRLQLFDLVDESTALLQKKMLVFELVEKRVVNVFKTMLQGEAVDSIAFTSRIKSAKSLKEKMIRNKYYLTCTNAKEVLELLPDLILSVLQAVFFFLLHHLTTQM